MGNSNPVYRRVPRPAVGKNAGGCTGLPAAAPPEGLGPPGVGVSCYTQAPFCLQLERLHPEESALSPILVRPVREQLEHDRVIRLLQAKYKRRFTVGMNPGAEQAASVGAGPDVQFPDLVLTSPGTGKKLAGVVEVETNESVNQLEAMAQWARLGRLPVEFILYVPSGVASVARRLCADHNIGVTEIWTYHTVGDQVRFGQVHRAALGEKLAAARAAAAEAKRAAAKALKPAKARPTRPAAKRPAAKPVRKAVKPAVKKAASKKR